MIPRDGLFTPVPVETTFLAPWDEDYNPLIEAVTGGIALNDGSKGRQVQRWEIKLNPATSQATIYPESGVVASTLTLPGAQTVSLAFDSNMNPSVAYQTATGSSFRYFNTLTGNYSTLVIADGDSCRCVTDDSRDIYNAASDVIFAYIRSQTLCYRVQREQYAIEHVIGTTVAGSLVRVGPAVGLRLQFKIMKV